MSKRSRKMYVPDDIVDLVYYYRDTGLSQRKVADIIKERHGWPLSMYKARQIILERDNEIEGYPAVDKLPQTEPGEIVEQELPEEIEV